MMYAAPQPAHRPPPRRARRPDAVVDARAGRDAGHVRARVRDGRARASRAAWTRSSCACATSPRLDPETGLPFSSRGLLECLREGAERFGWDGRDPTPGVRRDGRWLVGTGRRVVDLPGARAAPSSAFARANADGTFVVGIGAADIGTGARTVLTQVAADALEVPLDRVRVDIGDSALPFAMLAGGSMGTTSWGSAIVKAITALREQIDGRNGKVPDEGLEAEADTGRRHPRPGAVRPARVRRAVLRGARERRHRRGARRADARRVRLRADPQPADVAVAVPRRHDAGHLDGAARGERPRPRVRRLPQPRLRPVPRRRCSPTSGTWRRRGSTRTTRTSTRWARRASARSGSSGPRRPSPNAVFHATGARIRDLPIRLDRVLEKL